jgi:hypothetical protein
MPTEPQMSFEDWIVFLIRETCALSGVIGFVITLLVWAFVLGRLT